MYNYEKAAKLQYKADDLIRKHRQCVFDPNGEYHLRAIQRIKKLMDPFWLERHNRLVGERLLRTHE